MGLTARAGLQLAPLLITTPVRHYFERFIEQKTPSSDGPARDGEQDRSTPNDSLKQEEFLYDQVFTIVKVGFTPIRCLGSIATPHWVVTHTRGLGAPCALAHSSFAVFRANSSLILSSRHYFVPGFHVGCFPVSRVLIRPTRFDQTTAGGLTCFDIAQAHCRRTTTVFEFRNPFLIMGQNPTRGRSNVMLRSSCKMPDRRSWRRNRNEENCRWDKVVAN